MLRRAVLLVTLVACGDDPFTGLLKPPPAGEGMQMSLTTHVEPGQEMTVCKNFAVPEGTLDIGRFEHAMTPVSHHILVYQLDIPAADVTDEVLVACDESRENQMHRVGILYGAQGTTSDLALPEGIVFSARGGLSIQVEYHVFNTSDEPVDAEAAFNVWRSHDDVVGEAGMLFLYHNQIIIPPMSKFTARERNSYSQDFELMMMVPHMHSRGVAMEAFKDTGTGTPQQLFSVTGWENDTVVFDPPVKFQPGDVLDYHCDYDNQTQNYVLDGFSAKHDEMCVTGGIYFRHGDRLPVGEELRFGRGIVYTGHNTCSQVKACDEAIDYTSTSTTPPTAYDQYEMCTAAGCDGGTKAYYAVDNCRFVNCKDQCFTYNADGFVVDFTYDDPACTSCSAAMCQAELEPARLKPARDHRF